MRIGIDALGIEHASGGRTATLNLLKPLFQIDHDNHYCVSVSTYEPDLDVPGANVEQWVLPVRNRFIKRIYAQMAFPIKMRSYDVIHSAKI